MKHSLPFIAATFAEPIGVSLDARWIRAAQVTSVNGKASLVGAARLRRHETGSGDVVPPLTRDEASELLESLARQGLKSKQLVLAAPAQHATLTAIELPPRTSGAPLEQIAAMELSRLQRLEPGTFELALWELPKGPQRPGRQATAGAYIAATATHASGEALSTAFDGLGLAVTSLIPESLAIAKAAAMSLDSRAIVSLTWSGMEIVVLNEEAKIVYHRALPELGLHRIHVAVKERMGLVPDAVDGALAALKAGECGPDGTPLEENLRPLAAGVSRVVMEHADFVSVEVERSLAYSSRFSPDCEQKPIRIVGEGAALPGLPERLASQLGLEFSTLACGELLQVPTGSARHLGMLDMAAAIGASLWTQSTSQRMVA